MHALHEAHEQHIENPTILPPFIDPTDGDWAFQLCNWEIRHACHHKKVDENVKFYAITEVTAAFPWTHNSTVSVPLCMASADAFRVYRQLAGCQIELWLKTFNTKRHQSVITF